MPEKVSVVTLGCEKNLVDSEIMSGLVHQRGYSLVDKPEDATVVIVNTCGFIDAAKEESVNTILSLAELKETSRLKALIVSGCLTQRYKQELMKEMPEIDGIVGTGDFYRINDIIDEALRGRKPVYVGNPVFNYEESMPRLLSTPRHTAYVKIAEGCTIDVLVERYDGRSDVYVGRSQYDAPEVDGEVFITGCRSEIGEIRRVRITHAYEYDLSGEGIA